MSAKPPEHDLFTIGWICALAIEYTAARSFLDVKYDASFKDHRDNNDYTLGRIGEHNVVIVVCPDGEYGTTSAANAARDLARSFPNIRYGLMVGIGGGIPSREHDIRLGDVVVSSKVGRHSAVIQYDLGKRTADGTFEITSHLDNPPTGLRTAVSGLRTLHDEEGNDIQKMVDEAVKSIKKKSKYTRPDEKTDILHRSDLTNLPGGVNQDVSICSDTKADIICRADRSEEDDIPTVHYGPIGSGNCLVRDARMRDQLGQTHGILCCEMEAAGLMNQMPCLVIRGICDYADTYKNKQWQGYAAMTAAAYAKCLLLQLAPDQGAGSKTMRELLETQSSILGYTASIDDNTSRLISLQQQSMNDTNNDRIARATRALTEEQLKCMRALGEHPYNEFKDRNVKRVDGTCVWALNSDEFRGWLNGDGGSILWVSADPGCGKSVLAKSLVEDDIPKLHSTTACICHFFFKDNDNQNSLAVALCSVLHQLFEHEPELLRHVIEPWRKDKAMLVHKVDILWSVLLAACSDLSAPTVICVFDALDECRNTELSHDRIRFVRLLTAFHQSGRSRSLSRLKILVTSRPYQEIEEEFAEVVDRLPELRLRGEDQNDQIHAEINLVIDARLAQLAKKRRLQVKTRQRIADVLLSVKNRTYLWLYLVFDYIETRMRDALDPDECEILSVPPTVEGAYQKILDKAPEQERNTVRQILKIIVGARRPLTIHEMAVALGIAVKPPGQPLADVRLREGTLPERIRHLCGLFVFFDNSTIHLLHQTAKEFLIREVPVPIPVQSWHFPTYEAEEVMSYICAHYLTMADYSRYHDGDKSDSMLIYAAERWPEHYRNAGFRCGSIDASALLRDLYNSEVRLQRWFNIYWHFRYPHQSQLHHIPRVCLAAECGHDNILVLLLRDHDHVNQKDTGGYTALMRAAKEGFATTVRVLLDNGADVNAQGGEFGNDGNALNAAAIRGHLEVVKLLLDKGANVNGPVDWYGNALHAAAHGGHLEVVKLLLNKKVDVHARGGKYGTALQAAVIRGHLEVVRLLLDNGADITAHGSHSNALEAALAHGQAEALSLLVDLTSSVEAEGDICREALEAAYYYGNKRVVELLLYKHGHVFARRRKHRLITQISSHEEWSQLLPSAVISRDKRNVINASARPTTPRQ
ncbi:Ankyrin repeat-containing protein 24 [Elsinoe fawcettii]|nr:Ankyrin repeat-containing protein 24 [Elsinoe fawcettii]